MADAEKYLTVFEADEAASISTSNTSSYAASDEVSSSTASEANSWAGDVHEFRHKDSLIINLSKKVRQSWNGTF